MHDHARTFVIAAGATLAFFGLATVATPGESALDHVVAGAALAFKGEQGPTEGDVLAAQRIPYDDVAAPIALNGVDRPFGPHGPSFNLGIDLTAVPGGPVTAMADGDVYLADGPVVILRHVADADLPHAGRVTRRWYSVYSPVELARPLPALTLVKKGQLLGTLSGDAHALHLETLVGSAKGEHRATAATSPMRFLPYADGLQLSASIVSRDPLTIAASADAAAPILDEVRVKADGETTVVRFSDREGFTVADDGTISPTFADISTSLSTDGRRLEYRFVFPNVTSFDRALVRDIWGRGVVLEP